MKRTIIIFLAMLIVLSVLGVAYANGPGANTAMIDLVIDDYTQVSSIEMHIIYHDYDWLEHDKHIIIKYSQEDIINAEKTRKDSERIVEYWDSDVKNFYLVVTLKNGEVITTQNESHLYYGTFKFSTTDKTLMEKKIISRHLDIMEIVSMLFYALIWTVIIETIIGLMFKMRPILPVIIINLVTNYVMNMIILTTMYFFIVDYAILVIILEIIVVVVESIYYINWYPNKSKVRIITFAIVANLLSWGIYSLFNNAIYR